MTWSGLIRGILLIALLIGAALMWTEDNAPGGCEYEDHFRFAAVVSGAGGDSGQYEAEASIGEEKWR